MDRVLGELSTITDEGEWYEVISQVNQCYSNGRSMVPTRAPGGTAANVKEENDRQN